MDGQQRLGFVMPKKRPVERVIPRARDLALRPKTAAVPPSEQVLAQIGNTDLVAGIEIQARLIPLSSPSTCAAQGGCPARARATHGEGTRPRRGGWRASMSMPATRSVLPSFVSTCCEGGTAAVLGRY